ncbi:MAG: hypothetical protein ACODTL_22605 [Brucella sp.]
MLEITIRQAQELAPGAWTFDLPPHQVRMFGKCETAIGIRSVLLLETAQYDVETGDLKFGIEDATAINIGSSTDTIAILSNTTRESSEVDSSSIFSKAMMSRGDKEFLDLCGSELPDHMQRAARALLAGIRARSSGELKRGLSRNFSETPDNFWYVIVQPRVEQLSITVRGPVDLFEGVTHLAVKDDRGNTLFKVSGEQDVDAAIDLIFRAKRKY